MHKSCGYASYATTLNSSFPSGAGFVGYVLGRVEHPWRLNSGVPSSAFRSFPKTFAHSYVFLQVHARATALQSPLNKCCKVRTPVPVPAHFGPQSPTCREGFPPQHNFFLRDEDDSPRDEQLRVLKALLLCNSLLDRTYVFTRCFPPSPRPIPESDPARLSQANAR